MVIKHDLRHSMNKVLPRSERIIRLTIAGVITIRIINGYAQTATATTEQK